MASDESVKPPENIVKSYLAALVPFSCQFMLGAMLGQSSTMLPQLKEKDSPIKIDEEYASWIGFAFPSLVYISEICGPTHRAYLLACATVSSSVGLVYAYTAGAFINWDVGSLITSVIAIIALIYAFLIPESPAWLFQNHRLNETLDSLRWLRGTNLSVEMELKSLKDSCLEQPSTKVSFVHDLLSPTVTKPFLILLIFSLLQSGSGFYVLLHYSVEFMQACYTSFDPQLLGIILGVARLISTGLASVVINKVPRKTLGAASGLSMALFLGIALVFLVIFQNDAIALAKYSVIPAASLVLYVFACGLGVQPLPWTMIFEMYPLHVRGFMCGISYAMNFIFTFIFVKLYYGMMNNLKMQGTMFIFLVSSVLFCLYSLFILPETRGKTLIEIENGFLPKNRKKEANLN